jgi:hypothetical protein
VWAIAGHDDGPKAVRMSQALTASWSPWASATPMAPTDTTVTPRTSMICAIPQVRRQACTPHTCQTTPPTALASAIQSSPPSRSTNQLASTFMEDSSAQYPGTRDATLLRREAKSDRPTRGSHHKRRGNTRSVGQ